jgi:alcohol dehydrogenase (NADP+)
MKTLAFGNGDQMPILGLGTWKSKPGEVYAAVREAIHIGYRHIDCAAAYGNEAEIGRAIRDASRDGEVTRRDLWVTSKLWNSAHGRADVEPALRRSLTDLGLDFLDLYLIHWPVALKPGVGLPNSAADVLPPSEAPIELTWAAMEGAVRAGLARHIGLSNFSTKKIGDLLAHCTIRPEVNQVELHPFLQQPALVSYCAGHGIHLTAYSPLGSSDRPASFKAPDEPSLMENATIQAIARARGCTPAQVLLAWHVHRGVAVIPKSVHPARIRENFAAADIALTAGDLDEIAALDRHYRFLTGGLWVMPGSPWTLQSLWDEP